MVTRQHLMVFAFVILSAMVLTVAVEAAGQNDEVTKQIIALRNEIKGLQRTLRQLNEEGGEEAQDQAQKIMERICELQERLAQLEERLQQSQGSR